MLGNLCRDLLNGINMKEPRAASGGIALLTFLLLSDPKTEGGWEGIRVKTASNKFLFLILDYQQNTHKNIFYLLQCKISHSTAKQKCVGILMYKYFSPKGIVCSTEFRLNSYHLQPYHFMD